jgi:hypothetical protein
MSLYEELVTGALSHEIRQFILDGNDGAICERMNRKDISVYSKIEWSDFAQWAALTGIRADIEEWKTHANRSVRSIAYTLSDGLVRGAGTIDFGQAGNVAMLNQLVGIGLISQVNVDSLLSASTQLISRAEQLGTTVTISDIAQALRG